jgi:uracil-DNA glycosylase
MKEKDQLRSLLVEKTRRDLKNYMQYLSIAYGPSLAVNLKDKPIGYKIKKIKTDLQVSDPSAFSTLADIEQAVISCTKCSLHLTRKNTVFGTGTNKMRLVIIGEAPGADEDETGMPFVGRAGQLLTKMLSAIGIEREDVYICNVLKCRPPNNRDPLPEEIEKCSYYLDGQLEILNPSHILALGRIAASRLLKKQLTMKEFREGSYEYKKIPVTVTYHPSALLRNPNWKYPAWDDLKRLKQLLDESNG